MQIKKSRKILQRSAEETKRSAEARLAWAAGTDRLAQHDPLNHVTENFHQTFDRIGRSHAAAAAGGLRAEGEREDRDAREKRPTARKAPETPEQGAQEETGGVPRRVEPADALTRFSEIAFRRGAMSASVLNGTGKMMLVSCLKRTARETGPERLQQQTVAGTGSVTWAIPGQGPDQLVFNRGFADSALGIVTDTLRDARRVTESMEAVVRGTGGTGQADCAALFKLYPFLDDSRDAALEAEYRQALADCADAREKPVLQNALVHAGALRAKKAQMKNEFINRLRFLSDRAQETLAELEAPGLADELAAAAFGEAERELPENLEEGADGDAPNGKKNRSGKGSDKAERKRNKTGGAKAAP